jgi:hypothetical protein
MMRGNERGIEVVGVEREEGWRVMFWNVAGIWNKDEEFWKGELGRISIIRDMDRRKKMGQGEKVPPKRIYMEHAMGDEKKQKRKSDGRHDYGYKKGDERGKGNEGRKRGNNRRKSESREGKIEDNRGVYEKEHREIPKDYGKMDEGKKGEG